MPAASTPMMTTTTRISISVKPAARTRARRGQLPLEKLVADVPVADVGIDAFTAGRAVGSEAEQVVLLAVRAGDHVLVVVTPRVLAHAREVPARAPVLDRRVGRLCGQCRQALV